MSASRCLLVFALLTPALCPAADEKTATVQGVITLDGRPLPHGKVTFHFANGQFVGSQLKDGAYKIDHVPTGAFKVTIEATRNGVNLLPEKYASEESSALKVEVKPGANSLNFDLKSK